MSLSQSLGRLPTPPVSHRVWLKDPLAILADDAQAGLVIEGQKIVELVPQGQQPHSGYNEIMDCGHLVILPGLINGHHHFYQTLSHVPMCS